MLSTPGRSPRHIAIESPSQDGTPNSQLLEISSSKSSQKLFMGPPKRKRKEIILDEDTYVAAIEKIVERDFFPDLPKLQNRLEWLEAIRTGDPVRIREAQERIVKRRGLKVQGLGVTPSVAGTPLSIYETPGTLGLGVSPAMSIRSQAIGDSKFNEAYEKRNFPDTNLSLDAFLQKYTSEDNASFSAINESDNKRRVAKQQHFLQIEQNTNSDEDSRKTDGYGSTGQTISTLISWKYEPKNLLMYNSSEAPSLPLTKEELEERTHGPPKAVVKRNTRFHGNQLAKPFKEEDAVAILYTPVKGATPHFAERDKSNQNYDLEDLRRNSEAGDYSFVSTPSPAPGVDASPFMTWGEIEGTPLHLETEDTPIGIGGSLDGPCFKIPPVMARDKAAHGLSQSASKSIRDRARIQSGSLTPVRGLGGSNLSPALGSGGLSPGIGGSLSAAAQKLMDKTLKRKSSSVDENLRASYTGNTPGRLGKGLSRFNREGSLSLRSSSMSPAVSVKLFTPSPAPSSGK